MYTYSEILKDLENKAAEREVFYDTSVVPLGCGNFVVLVSIAGSRHITRVSRVGNVDSDGTDAIAKLQEEVTMVGLSEIFGMDVPEVVRSETVQPDTAQQGTDAMSETLINGFKLVEEPYAVPEEITTNVATQKAGESGGMKPEEKAETKEDLLKAAVNTSGRMSDDFQVKLGKYKEVQEGNWFSELLENDPGTLKRLLRVPNPTAPEMQYFQEHARAYLNARDAKIA